ncbi:MULTISPECIES: peptidoglycan DD-metalloendopeptidase family protein [unclassified Dehalobacter]|jgi:murein DD-endopeptidase MepM/ murein hydrolase activator NlpD|uniref:peptidoglycan DD-metalloendopeptidase family protein n=1 Tax=unclassified Dehalobacter TaxID=2635733 RepID=UPI00028B25AC|nr:MULTISPECIES: peptidoglycan DD-metalloendopeptidase family protein [unclassified Dehalobacter]AFV01627.1 Putative peptidase, M23/M37 family [Dehalobacter sp. DCA]AFV04663.1 Membrane protein related to metalloendopeptidase [Dehalobacter sp. CF]
MISRKINKNYLDKIIQKFKKVNTAEALAKQAKRIKFGVVNLANKIEYKEIFSKTAAKIKNISWKSPKTIGITALALAVIFSGCFYFSATTPAVGIVVNGKNIGYAASKSEAKQLVQEILTQQGSAAGTVAQTSDTIEYKSLRLKNEDYTGPVSKDVLANAIKPYVDGFGLQVNGKVVVALANEQDINTLLKKYEDYQTKPSKNNTVSLVKIVEPVSKIASKVHPSEVKTVDAALEILVKGDVAETTYTIQEDDSLWLIARKNNMLTDEVIAANPGFTEDSVIQPGQKIKLVQTKPYLTVRSEGTKVVSEIVPFDVVSKTDSSIGYGKSIIKQAGKDGEKAVTYSYVEENGKMIEKQVVKEEVVSKPVNQIVAKGPGRSIVYVGTSRGSGSISGLSWPISGGITSYYGSRHGSFHTGIDIDGVTGQPYYAAASGTVVEAGWDGGYGYCIMIDHGNGVSTRYGHSSKLFVSVGQTVSKGQNIGNVGSTGNSTGSHLHFEVIINGSTVNPLNYL